MPLSGAQMCLEREQERATCRLGVHTLLNCPDRHVHKRPADRESVFSNAGAARVRPAERLLCRPSPYCGPPVRQVTIGNKERKQRATRLVMSARSWARERASRPPADVM
jgi:hypothetical protein